MSQTYSFRISPNASKYFPANRPVLPEWTKVAWSSVNEQMWWTTWFNEVQLMWQALERESVVHGLRPAAWTLVSQNDLPSATAWATQHGLSLLPLTTIQNEGAYVSSSMAPEPGKPWLYRALLVHPNYLPFIAKHKNLIRNNGVGDNDAMGELLGYPKCCREFFQSTWGAHQVDSTYDQLMATGPDGPSEANMLWRWLYMRAVLHLPCSSTCQATVDIGKKYRNLAIMLGFVEETKVLDQVLNWPVKWSAINGIAEITGPCVKISTRTDWSPEQRVINRQGTYVRPDATLWTDNGFTGPEAMLSEHKPVIAGMAEHLAPGANIVDLGCGNGYLLNRLKIRRPDIKIGGVDVKADAITRARGDLRGTWIAGKIEDEIASFPNANAVIISPERLLEMKEEDAVKCIEWLNTIPQVFVYAYDDCIVKHESLTKSCAKAGLKLPAIISGTNLVQLGVINNVVSSAAAQ